MNDIKETPTFEELPRFVFEMNRKLDLLLSGKTDREEIKDRLMTMEELQDHLPEHPAKPTIYQKVNERKIPFEKHGRRLYFRKSTIDEWLANGRQI